MLELFVNSCLAQDKSSSFMLVYPLEIVSSGDQYYFFFSSYILVIGLMQGKCNDYMDISSAELVVKF